MIQNIPYLNPTQKDLSNKVLSVHSGSSNSLDFKKQKSFDTIQFRIDFIKTILNGKKLEPMIEFDPHDTDDIINQEPNAVVAGSPQVAGAHNHAHGVNHDNCRDIRCILNKKMYDFYNVINQIGGKLIYIKSGTTGHTFKGIVSPDPVKDATSAEPNPNVVNYAVKVVAYPKKEKYGDLNDIRRPENAELLMIRVLSNFVINKQTPHIVLPIGTFNTNIETFVKLTKDKIINNKKYDMFVKRYKKGDYYDKVSVLISEWANNGDLLDYLKKNYTKFTLDDWKVLFFQVLSVLAVIHKKYPAFRHNDLKANNILIHQINSKTKRNLFKYEINDYLYEVPNVGFQVKLWDFDFACIKGVVDNAKVEADWTKQINITSKKNRYYDIHYFFNTLTKKAFFPQFYEAPEIPQKVKEFVDRVIPPEYKTGRFVAERGRILVNKEYTTPDKLLKNDPFFKQFRLHRVKTTKTKKLKKIV